MLTGKMSKYQCGQFEASSGNLKDGISGTEIRCGRAKGADAGRLSLYSYPLFVRGFEFVRRCSGSLRPLNGKISVRGR